MLMLIVALGSMLLAISGVFIGGWLAMRESACGKSHCPLTTPSLTRQIL
jgi:hypothetical protein